MMCAVPVIRSAEYVTSAVAPQGYPQEGLPEVAFAGRSNVGKSSLINILLGRKKLVRTSATPGRTQTLNFFRINDAFVFVDLPGYGYAKVPPEIRKQWGPMVEQYLTTRRELAGLVHIMDLRHPPTADDLQLWNWLQSHGLHAVPVLTKADKVPRSKRLPHAQAASRLLGVAVTDIVLFSATTREGVEALWARLLPWIQQPA
ncbi:GTP-binding protein [Desulfosoma caldarium]|uniref:Probable GTP-binding protein EngB n=2 Tax=Desulfosoma caldarium TaxID=610254 RepID=A0A3N1VKG7_9BACT|nr:GTP-binding protein [Desulfosoma caldarium]